MVHRLAPASSREAVPSKDPVKLDDKNRLLFKLGQYGGQTVLLILEVVRNHDYAKARFLNGGTWRWAR